MDTEGEHRVDEFKFGLLRKATDKFHQEVAITACDLIFIVINGLTSYTRDYVDTMIKKIVRFSSGKTVKSSVAVVHNFKNGGGVFCEKVDVCSPILNLTTTQPR